MATIEKKDKIYVAGHRGLVGSAIVRAFNRKGYEHIVGRTHTELDLTEQSDVRAFFEVERPDVVVLAAAKVGGINANNTSPAEFAYSNMQIMVLNGIMRKAASLTNKVVKVLRETG